MRILVSAGAFKQSLTATEACAAIARGLAESGLGATVEQLPIADGGNGTLDAFLASGGDANFAAGYGSADAPDRRRLRARRRWADGGHRNGAGFRAGAAESRRAESAGGDHVWHGAADGGCAGARRRADHYRLGRQRHGRWRHGLPERAWAKAGGCERGRDPLWRRWPGGPGDTGRQRNGRALARHRNRDRLRCGEPDPGRARRGADIRAAEGRRPGDGGAAWSATCGIASGL